MKITVLCENEVGHAGAKTCTAAWGLSLHIQTGSTSILFDTGPDATYRQNAENLGLNLQDTDFIVLSHAHWDHIGGLQHQQFTDRKPLILHPHILKQMSADKAAGLESAFNVSPSAQPVEFTENVFYLGKIPRKTGFEKGTHKGDPMPDDSAIALKTPQGAVIITGCSHAGICNICDYAKQVTGQKLFAVIGGFHLTVDDQKTVNGTIDYFKAQKPAHLYPLHCVDFPTLAKFHKLFSITKAGTGDTIEFD